MHINYYSNKSILQIDELLEELSNRNTVERLELLIDIKGIEVIGLTEKVSRALGSFSSLLDLKLSSAFNICGFVTLPFLKVLTCSNEKINSNVSFTDDLIFFANNAHSLQSLYFTSPKGPEIKTYTMFRLPHFVKLEYTK